jgi:AraC family transcriptional regulator
MRTAMVESAAARFFHAANGATRPREPRTLSRVNRLPRRVAASFFEQRGLRLRCELDLSSLHLRELASDEPVDLPLHLHESAHIAFVIRGEMSCSCLLESYPRWAGVFHPPASEHETRFSGGARVVMLELERRWLERLEQHDVVPRACVVLGPQSSWLATRLVDEFRNPHLASTLVIEGLVCELLAAAARAAEVPVVPPPAWFSTLVEHIHAHFALGTQLNELAAEYRVHPARLSLLFKRHLGVTPGEYERHLRVWFMQERLAESEQSVADLTLAAGFSDQSHGTREFKRVTGMTPARYRRLLRSGERTSGGPRRRRFQPIVP